MDLVVFSPSLRAGQLLWRETGISVRCDSCLCPWYLEAFLEQMVLINCLRVLYWLCAQTLMVPTWHIPREPGLAFWKPGAHAISEGAVELRVLVNSSAVNWISRRGTQPTERLASSYLHSCGFFSINGQLSVSNFQRTRQQKLIFA